MTNVYNLIVSLIRSEVDGTSPELPDVLTQKTLEAVYNISRAHDLSHLCGSALLRADISMPIEMQDAYKKDISLSQLRYLKINNELTSLTSELEDAKIPHIILKGSVLRYLYPEPWMRTSCDIDVLIKKEDVCRAIEHLERELDYQSGERASHDISLFSAGGVHVELHFRLLEDSKSDEFFDNIWDAVSLAENSSYTYVMTNEMFYTYHIAHMSKHFRNGGCGIRPFLDIAIMKRNMPYDKTKTINMLQKCGLAAFANAAESLSNVWFGTSVHTELTISMEDFVINGGIYGTLENYVTIKQSKSGGKLKYILSRIFIPYSILKGTYPKLDGRPILLPYYQMKRLFTYIFKKDKSRLKRELSYNNSVSGNKKNELSALMDELKLG